MANAIKLNILIVGNAQLTHLRDFLKASHNTILHSEQDNRIDAPTLNRIRDWVVELPLLIAKAVNQIIIIIINSD